MSDPHADRARRIAALEDTELLDSPPEAAYDRVTATAARLLRAPIALLSLVDRDRQFFKSSTGLAEPLASQRETPLSYSYCKHTVESGNPFVVDDAREHPLVRDNLATTEMGIRSYAGVPIFQEGEAIGTLCVLGPEPRKWTSEDIELLRGLAAGVQSEIALRSEVRRLHATQRALYEAEERYRSLVDALPVIVYLAEPVAPFGPIYVSPAVISLGYSLEEWTSAPDLWVRLLHPEDRDRVIAETESALARHAMTDYEYRMIARDGEVHWIHDRGRFVIGPGGQPLYWQGVMVDITSRKAAESVLQEQRKELRQIIDVVPHLLFVKDDQARYILGNQAFAALYGRRPDEVVGKTDLELGVPASQAALFQAQDREVMQTGLPTTVTSQERAGVDGERRIYDVLKVPFRRAGTEKPAVLGLVRDVTSEREQLQQLQRAERLASVGTLVGGVAHELNNPLSAIKGLSELLMMDSHSDEDREALETIHRESDRMARIVADLRRLARESQENGGPRVPVDLNEVARHVLRLREYSLSTHNIAVVEDLQPDLGAVMADPGRMEQVVLNLVVNAEQAMSAHAGRGTLTLRTRSGRHGVSLCVEDTGPGVGPEQRERVFDPFWTTKAPGEGTGLGLSLSHGIVDSLGGRITVDGAPSGGARFTVVLPRAAATETAPAPPEAAKPPSHPKGASLRILIVDDEVAVRSMLARYLKRRGHDVSEASEGSAALNRLKEASRGGTRFDVIISDLRMPGLDGSQLLTRLREGGDGMADRLIFLTGDGASPEAEHLLRGAAVPVLLKPFDFARLEEMIHRVAGGGAGADGVLREKGTRLHEDTSLVLQAFVDRLRTDPGIQNTMHLGDADLEDHTCLLISGIAQALVIPDMAVVDREALLRDGKRLIQTVADLHGAQRSRIGWTEASLAREYQILEEEIVSALRSGGRSASEGEAEGSVSEAITNAHGISLAALRRESKDAR